ncbi:MarR family transcriptional regulator [Paenibacillus aurantius]|uniref:MarR family transcriptional regulator n=1 Tax=Paenibacillus aurantius TaxID=2918900 RepID=A0AA96LJ03_9BACL|nr:MarR family transcriptional regulator [Paenibacillus aurantius]WNQ14175.1 MarR family transcriptional regulator [Paenibacillus aurantius]
MNPALLGEFFNEVLIKSTVLVSNRSFVEGLTPKQVHIVMEIGENVFRHGELAGRLGVETSTLTRTLDPLVKNGYVDRQLNPDNRREVLIRLSDTGRTLLEQIRGKMIQGSAVILQQVPEEQREQVEASIRLLLTIMRKMHFPHE